MRLGYPPDQAQRFRAFVFIAFQTGKREVEQDCQAVVFARNDVIYLMQKIECS
jgi:hypothetical protein